MSRRTTTYRVIPTNRPQKAPRARTGRLSLFISIILILVSYSMYAVLRPLPYSARLLVSNHAAQATSLVWPRVGQAAIGLSGQGIVAASPNQTIAPIASVTKLITAIAVLEHKPLSVEEQGDLIEFSQIDVDILADVVSRDGAALAVEPGQTMTQRQALEAMILPSANNIAVALANWAFGSEEAYVAYANEMVKKLGLHDTYIATASGLDAATTSSLRDLVLLSQIVDQNQLLREITAMPEARIPGYSPITNVNHVSTLNPGINAQKVGLTDEAGSCLVYWFDTIISEGETIRLYGAVLGQDNFQDLAAYVNLAVDQIVPANLSYKKVISAGQQIAEVSGKKGKTVIYSAAEDLSIPYWEGTEITYSLHESDPSKLIVKNEDVSYEVQLHTDQSTDLAVVYRLLHPV